MKRTANMRKRLGEPQSLVSTFCMIPCTDSVELIALAGFDAVILDMEHGPMDIGTVRLLAIAAAARGIYCIVRVRANDPTLIGAALDIGVDGVLVPQVSRVDEARRAVAAARFAPCGERGANPWVRAAHFGGQPAWYEEANSRAAVLVMIEGAAGAAAAADIMRVEGLDGVFLGPVDFSHSLGFPGQVDHPRVVEKFEEIIRLGQTLKVATSVFAPTPDRCKSWIDKGATMVAVGCDTAHVRAALTAVRLEVGTSENIVT